MSVSDVVSSVVKPVDRLIEVVANAIGEAYELKHIRKMADAKAYELRNISDELRNNSDLPIVYNSIDSIEVNLSDYNSLIERTGKRLAYQEIQR